MATPKAWEENLEKLQRLNRAIEDENYSILGEMSAEAKIAAAEAQQELGAALEEVSDEELREILFDPDKASMDKMAVEMLAVLSMFENDEDKVVFLSSWFYAFIAALSKMYDRIK